jgi:hypothetical protein
MRVDNFNGKTPAITGEIIVNGMVEGLDYEIVEINNPKFLEPVRHSEPPKVGEIISIDHDFQPDENGYNGYEFLSLIIGRTTPEGGIHNYVRYFKNLAELKEVLDGNKFKLDKRIAIQRITELKRKIKEISDAYGIERDI